MIDAGDIHPRGSERGASPPRTGDLELPLPARVGPRAGGARDHRRARRGPVPVASPGRRLRVRRRSGAESPRRAPARSDRSGPFHGDGCGSAGTSQHHLTGSSIDQSTPVLTSSLSTHATSIRTATEVWGERPNAWYVSCTCPVGRNPECSTYARAASYAMGSAAWEPIQSTWTARPDGHTGSRSPAASGRVRPRRCRRHRARTAPSTSTRLARRHGTRAGVAAGCGGGSNLRDRRRRPCR